MDILIKNAKELIKRGKDSDFYNVAEQRIIIDSLRTDFHLYGGIESAERKIIKCNDDYPLKVIRITFKKNVKLTHSDLLGSIMALGIERKKTGDIILSSHMAFVIVKKEIAPFISLHLSKVGKQSVLVECVDIDEIVQSKQIQLIKKINVPSLRMDAVVASAFTMARNKSVYHIKGQKVLVNYQIVDKPSYQVKENDIISIRGKGRVHIKEILNLTKKGRLNINIVVEK